ncbi:MAG: hypothetical protein KF889_01520 [Alphaproteobacteria bacterium]|nr:hypothetical protein [Alphaproteobacteria bacterium]MCW5741583.1 hypothetical protein [Alphaproteobacteria bacterium]
MNKLYIGFTKDVRPPRKRGYLFINDEVRELHHQTRVFDPLVHCFNPLKGIDYKRARELAEVLYTIAPQGENTLTVRNGKRTLLRALLAAESLDRVDGDEEVAAMIGDLLVSPVLKRVLCTPGEPFSFKPSSAVIARLNRAELGEFDALVLGLLLLNQYRGQVVVPDLGFYGRNQHANLVRERRLIGGCNFLEELPDKLRQACLSIEDKELRHASSADAELVAKLSGLVRGTNDFNGHVKQWTE